MKTRAIIGITALVLTLIVMIPVVFFLTRGAVSPNQFGVITAGVLFLILWTISYAMLVDPCCAGLLARSSTPRSNGVARASRYLGDPRRRRDAWQVSSSSCWDISSSFFGLYRLPQRLVWYCGFVIKVFTKGGLHAYCTVDQIDQPNAPARFYSGSDV
jgi:hypothetical protein